MLTPCRLLVEPPVDQLLCPGSGYRETEVLPMLVTLGDLLTFPREQRCPSSKPLPVSDLALLTDVLVSHLNWTVLLRNSFSSGRANQQLYS